MKELSWSLGKALFPYFVYVLVFTIIIEIFIVIKRKIKNKVNQKIASFKTNGGICPRCGGALIMRDGKYGRFIGCSNFPKCRYTKR